MTTNIDEQYERMREYQADLTPLPVIMQGLEWVESKMDLLDPPKSILDPCAGSGAFAVCIRHLWPDAKIFAIEPRQEEEKHLKQHYDDYVIGYIGDCIDQISEWGPFDLITTNPAFRLIAPKVGLGLPQLLAPHTKGVMHFLGQDDVGQRSAAGVRLFQTFPPARQGRITGPIGFRGPKFAQDARDYSWWVWKGLPMSQPKPIPSWTTDNLPSLDSYLRKWKISPGTEYLIEESFPWQGWSK